MEGPGAHEMTHSALRWMAERSGRSLPLIRLRGELVQGLEGVDRTCSAAAGLEATPPEDVQQAVSAPSGACLLAIHLRLREESLAINFPPGPLTLPL